MKDIKDYLHLYLGCELITTDPQTDETSKGYLTGIAEWPETCVEVQLHNGIHADEEPTYKDYSEVKPILRPLSSMTEEEQFELAELIGVVNVDHFIKAVMHKRVYNLRVLDSFEVTRYLLSKGFDIFNLIPDGLAIDSTLSKMETVQP